MQYSTMGKLYCSKAELQHGNWSTAHWTVLTLVQSTYIKEKVQKTHDKDHGMC